jgi:hypothetical protein
MNTLKLIVCLIIFVLSSQSNSQTPPSYTELQGLKAELESTKLKLEICAIEVWSKDGLKQIESLIKYFDERGRDRPNDIVESAAWIFVGRLDSCSNEKDQAAYALYRYMASTGNRGRGFQEEKYALRGALNNDLSKTIAKIKELRFGY